MEKLIADIALNLIEKNRWKYIVDGLFVTLTITFFALLLGLFIGFLIAIVKNINKNTGKMKILSKICDVYLTIIRGTPVVVQLLIIYYVVFQSVRIEKIFVAIITFGINSGAYQAEIFRSGIESIPKGQMEAGRSLGFNYSQTMILIILPQAIKNVLPTLGNEFISLLKETSVAGFIALEDLTKGGDIIRSQTYSPMFPLFVVAGCYLILVLLLSSLIRLIENRMRKSERRSA